MFIVGRQEIWVQEVAVRARSEQEALALVADGKGVQLEGLSGDFEWSHNASTEGWPVREASEEETRRAQTSGA
jgi:hypothetical protein